MNRWKRTQKGGTLIEILVVIVVFLVGILVLAQIFPGGLAVLRTTRNNTMAVNLARSEMDRLKGQADQLAEAILPVRYVWTGTQYRIEADLDRRPEDINPASTLLDQNGEFRDPTDPNRAIGEWSLLSGPNVIRRIVAEGKTIPAPRYVQDPSANSTYGSAMTLQFAPIVFDPRYEESFLVYGNDLTRRIVDEVPVGAPVRQDYIAFINDEGTELALPQGPPRPDRPGFERRYRVSVSLWIRDASNNLKNKDVVSAIVTIPAPASAFVRSYYAIPLGAAPFIANGETFERAEVDTLRVARLYDRLDSVNGEQFLTEAQVRNNAGLLDDAVYQYDLLDANMGLLLFNPLGFNYKEFRNRGRVPLVARSDYDVLDWRIIRDDFRVPTRIPAQQKFILNSIKVLGNNNYADGRPYPGVGVRVLNASNIYESRDVILLDTETGGIFLPEAYTVDKNVGLMTFNDIDANPANGLTAQIMYPRATAPATINDIRGRSVRALYQGRGEFAVQIDKAPRTYRVIGNSTLGIGQCYVGGTDINVVNDDIRRVYFPLSDIGKQVVIGEMWYVDSLNQRHVLQEQEFLIQAPRGGELQLGYVDLRDRAADATGFDFSNGYAVRRVRGATVNVRAVWNPNSFLLGTDQEENFRRYIRWTEGWRKTRTETFLMGGTN